MACGGRQPEPEAASGCDRRRAAFLLERPARAAVRRGGRRSRRGRRKQGRELLRQLWPDARLFVLEEDERVLPLLPQRLHRLGPVLEILRCVPLVAQPHVAEVGSGDERGMPLLRVRDAQRGVPHPQRLIYVVREPRRVTELPGAPQVRRELGEEIVQPVEVLLEVGRQLEQDRPELGAKLASRLEKVAQRVVDALEPGDVGDALRCLEHERKARRRGRVPTGDGLRVRHPVEGIVDLDRREPLGVVLEHLRLGEFGGIERPLPLGEVVARCPDANRHATQTVWMLTNSLSPYSDSSRPYPESLTPPNGSRGSDFTSPLTKTEPTSSSRASRSPRTASAVHTEAPRP